MLCQWQQAQLNASSETSWVCYMFALADSAAVKLRQSVYKVVVVTLDAVIHREVDNLQIFGNHVTFHELLSVAMSRAEKQHVYAVQWKLISEDQIRFTVKTFVNVSNLVAGVTRTIYENYFYIGVIKKLPYIPLLL